MISTTGRSISYTGNGTKTEHSFPFALIDVDHLVVTIDGVVQTAYTVLPDSNRDTGATLTFTTAPAAATNVVLKRVTPLTQLTDYTPGDRFNAETHEDALDKLTLILQEADDNHARSFKAPDGTSTVTKATTSMYGKYLGLDASGNLVGLVETVGGTGGGTSNFDMDDASDLDLITTGAAGTTTIAIPNTSTPVFGIHVTVDTGSYAHNIKLPTPGSTGQRAFLRVRFSSAHDSTVIIKDHNDVSLFELSGARKQYITDLRIVSSGSTWIIDKVQRGEICVDRFHGTTYMIPADPSSVPNSTELATAVADTNPAVIYLDNLMTMSTSVITIPERHTVIVGAGAGFSFTNSFGEGNGGLIFDGELITALDDQAVFVDANPGQVRGKFGGIPINPGWWDDLSTIPALAFPDDWNMLQSAVLASDWSADGSATTITNWDDTTEIITVADTNNFAEGDAVTLQGTLGADLIEDRLLFVVESTSGAGTTLSTFKLALSPGGERVLFGTGGSLAATVTKMKCQRPHSVVLNRPTYTIDRPIVWAGSGAHLIGNGSKITAITGDWASRLVDVDTFSGDHSPMLVIGQNDPESWDNIPCGVKDLTLDGGSIALVSGIGAEGHIPRRSRVSGVVMVNVSNHYIGWAKAWSARPGYAATNDTSYLTTDHLDLRSMNTAGAVVPIPLHCPGSRFSMASSHISGDSSIAILEGANQLGSSFRDIDWDGAGAFVRFTDDALYLKLHLDNIYSNAEVLKTVTVASTNTSTNVFTSVAHGLLDGEVVHHDGTGTIASGLFSVNAYIIHAKTDDTFKLAAMPGGGTFGVTTDNGAFDLEKVGTVIDYRSAQANARVTAFCLDVAGSEVFLVDATQHNRIIVGGQSRQVDEPRRVDSLSWGDIGYTALGNGEMRVNSVLFNDSTTQPNSPDRGEVMLTQFETADGQCFIVMGEDPTNTTERWKALSLEDNNQSFTVTTSDPEV